MQVFPKEVLKLLYHESQYFFGKIGDDGKPIVCKSEQVIFVYPEER
jgi:hypothetical protein